MSLAEYDFQVLYMDTSNCWHDEDRYTSQSSAVVSADRTLNRPHVKKVRVVKRIVVFEGIKYAEGE